MTNKFFVVLYEMHSFNNQGKLKVTNILSTANNQHTHHKRLQVVFTGPSEWMKYMYTLWPGPTNFTKTLR